MTSIFEVPISSINGDQDILSTVKGKVCLFVNIATKCGYTPTCSPMWSFARTSRQLWELQQLHEMYYDRGFSVVGLPCNQFHGMEPSSNEEIAEFLKIAYPFVTFPVTEKVDVNGVNEHRIFTILKGNETRRSDDSPADTSAAAMAGQNLANQAIARVPGNNEKFIVGRDGRQLMRFSYRNWPLAEVSLTNESEWTIKGAVEMLTSDYKK